MSRIKLQAGNVLLGQRERWSPEGTIFTTCRENNGPLAQRQGRNFGASYASIILGPDLARGQGPTNAPSIGGNIWDTTVPNGPVVTFAQDGLYTWIRGHMINGRWGGSGGNWNNLTPLTSQANSNHKTVEAYMDSFISASYGYEVNNNVNGYGLGRDDWYGVYYCVRCSQSPFADPMTDAQNNLYSYAPAFIKVSWRAVRIAKPVGQQVNNVIYGMNILNFQAVAVFPAGFIVPNRPQVLNGVNVLPAGNVAGGNLLGNLPVGFPNAQANNFDGDIEIHQS